MADQGLEIQALINRPALTLWTRDIHAAFYALTDSRPVYMGGVGAIPMTEIESYLNLAAVWDEDDRFRILNLIKRMDGVYLDLLKTKQEKEQTLADQRARNVGSTTMRPRKSRLPGR